MGGGASASASEAGRNLNSNGSAHDSTTSMPSSARQQPPLQPRLRRIALAVGRSIARLSRWLDEALTHVLQDSNTMRLTPDKQHVVPEFKPRNPRVLWPLRKLWAFFCLVAFLIWLLLGVVPGIRGGSVVSASRFDPNHPPAAASNSSTTTSICACTYSPIDTLFAAPPYTMLVSRRGFKPPSFQTLLSWCDPSSHSLDLRNRSNPGPWWIAGVLDEMSFQLTAIRAVAPASPILLSQQGWAKGHFSEVFRASMAISTAAQARIASAPPAAIPDVADVAAGLDAVAWLQGSFNQMMGALLGMPAEALTFDMVDRQSNRSAPLHCNAMPPLEQLPVALLEWCKRPQDTATISDNSANCSLSDAYGAYVRFCAPALCHTLAPKTRYLQAMQILVALGGMFSIVSVFAFAITWRTLVCGLEKLLDLDGWLGSCSRSCRGAADTGLAACSSPRRAWNKLRLNTAGSAAAAAGQPQQPQQKQQPASKKDAGDDGFAPPLAGFRADDDGAVARADADV